MIHLDQAITNRTDREETIFTSVKNKKLYTNLTLRFYLDNGSFKCNTNCINWF
jgi:hypothetical protein